MWIKYINATPENRIGDIVFVGDIEAKLKISEGKAVSVTGPDGLVEDAQVVEKPVKKEAEEPIAVMTPIKPRIMRRRKISVK
jgi:hypothetical protein